MPTDTAIELRFDRFLLPSTAIRQSIRVFAGDPTISLPLNPFDQAPHPVYDVVGRIFTFKIAELQPRTLYTVELLVPNEEQQYGFRAIDGAPMGNAGLPLRFSFYTSGMVRDAGEFQPPPPSCKEVVALFGKCTRCHGNSSVDSRNPGVMGMDLSWNGGLLGTAIDQVAHETDFGPTTGEAYVNSPRFGVSMPRIAAGAPENSYLLYKVLMRPENYGPKALGRERADGADEQEPVIVKEECVHQHRLASHSDCGDPPSPEELARLREWFVRGEPMPLPESEYTLSQPDLVALQAWIRAGAECSVDEAAE